MYEDLPAAPVVDDHNPTEPEVTGKPHAAVMRPIPLGDLDAEAQPWMRALDENTVKDLAQSLKTDGLLHPITVRLSGSKYQLVAGRHRVASAKLLGWETIQALVLDADDQQVLMACIDENLRRKTLTGAEKTEAVAKLRQAFEAKYGKISKKGGRPKKTKTTTPRRSFTKDAAKKMGKSTRTVQRIEARDKAIPEVKEALAVGRINEGQLDELAKLNPDGQRLVLAQCEGKTRDEARRLVAQHRDGGQPAPTPAEPPAQPTDSAPSSPAPNPAPVPTSEAQRLTADFMALVDAVAKLLAGGGTALDPAAVGELEAAMERALDLLRQLRERRQSGSPAEPAVVVEASVAPSEVRRPRNKKLQIQDV